MNLERERRIYYREGVKCLSDYNSDFLSVIAVLGGSFSAQVNGKVFFLTAPHLLLLNPKTELAFLSSYNLTAKSISFTPHFLNPKITKEILLSASYSEFAKNNDFHQLLAFHEKSSTYYHALPMELWGVNIALKLFDTCNEEMFSDDEQWSCRARAILFRLLDLTDVIYRRIYLLRALTTANNSGFLTAKEYIETHFSKDLTLSKLCNVSMLNRNILNSLFVENLKTTTKGYLSKCRMNHARRLLSTTDLNVNEIAEKCGYKYITYFDRAFKEQTGLTPKAYRKNAFEKRN